MFEGLLNACLGFVMLIAIFVPLERTFAARRVPFLRAELRLDLVFFVFQYVVMAWVLLSANEWLQRAVGPLAPSALVARVALLPLAAKAVLVVVLGDVALYWAHRLSHTIPALWRFHAVHHSVRSLDWLAAHREHPLDGLYSQIFLNLPAFVLGVDREVMMPVFVFRGLCAIFVHSNVRVRLGAFGLLFGDPVLHRWHHANVEQTRHNFANLAPYLDVLFRTHHRPSDESYALGIGDAPRRGFLQHLVAPFATSPSPPARARRAAGPP